VKIALCGFGAFNTSIALHLDKFTDNKLVFWDRTPAVGDHFNKNRSHPHHFSDKVFSENISSVDSLQELVKDADHIIIGVSSQAVREVTKKFTPYLNKPSIVTVMAKGFEERSHKRLSEVLTEELAVSKHPSSIAIFSGGTVAHDVAHHVPLIAEVASEDKDARERVAELFHSKSLRVYTNADVLSVELAGALKNVVSLGAGVCEGLGFAVGTQASFISRASFDIFKLAKTLGANDETFLPGSASFWGDIMLSSFGNTRNREFEKRIVGSTSEKVLSEMKKERKTVEGFLTTQAAYEMVTKHNVSAPCIKVLYHIVHNNLNPKDALTQLMNRSRKSISKV